MIYFNISPKYSEAITAQYTFISSIYDREGPLDNDNIYPEHANEAIDLCVVESNNDELADANSTENDSKSDDSNNSNEDRHVEDNNHVVQDECDGQPDANDHGNVQFDRQSSLENHENTDETEGEDDIDGN